MRLAQSHSFQRCHCIGIALFAVCCIPCYFCTDSCCVKKMLISQGSLSKEAIQQLEEVWTWNYCPSLTQYGRTISDEEKKLLASKASKNEQLP